MAGRQARDGRATGRQWWHGAPKASPRALARRFAASMGLTAVPASTVERLYLDTFDWLVFADDEVLVEERTPRERPVLVLQDRSGQRADLVAAAGDAPRRAADLPGALERRLHDTIGPRALIEVGRERAEVWSLKSLDDDTKTTAFVDVERVTVAGAGPVLRVQLRPVRGYEREARRLQKVLDSQADLTKGTDPFVMAARAVGREPTSNPRVPVLPTDPNGPGRAVLAAVFEYLLGAVVALEDGVRRQLDPEFLHDFRITVRRTRSTVRLARPFLADDVVSLWEPEWSWLASATSAPRDLDVLVDDLDAHYDGVGAIDPELKEGMADLIGRLTARRDGANAALVTTLAGERYGTLKRGWRVAVNEMRVHPESDVPRAGALSAAIAGKGARQVLEHARKINSDSPASDVHALRKRVKRARYVLELFSPLLSERDFDWKAVGRDMSDLQDTLGIFQDADVQRHLVTRLVAKAEALPPETARAAEHMIEVFATRQAEAREVLGPAIARATKGAVGRRLERLAAAGS